MWAPENAEMTSEGEVTHDNNNTVNNFEKTNKQTISTTTFGENNDYYNRSLKLKTHSKEDRNFCTCTKQVTIHVIIVVLSLVTVLGIGILVGYFIGKPEEYNGKLNISICCQVHLVRLKMSFN